MTKIHPTAIIDPTARIGDAVEIGPYCVIGADVEIGAGTVLMNHVTVLGPTTMGRNNTVFPLAVLGADPQDRKYRGEKSRLVVGDGNQFREHVTIHRGTANGGGSTTIGDRNLVMVGAHIAHDCHLGHQIQLANHVMLAGHVRIEDGATISGGTGVHHFVTIGTLSFVGGLARISRDVPPFMTVEGNPAEVRSPNRTGMERRGFDESHIEAIRECYRRLFVENGGPMADRMRSLRDEFPDVPAVAKLCDALAARAEGVHGRSLEVLRQDKKRTLQLQPLHISEEHQKAPHEA
ncbi:MAG: acyl-ACP--UDP-N-acetylglucosamine O-acyltransferase [Phycisphaerales bacterium]|nr:acyl-ACP--UDP-N-acetylglucosamine O-acyltransferase [Phycisphaerales bacterium]